MEHDNTIMPNDSTIPCSSQDCETLEPWQAPVISDHEKVTKNHDTLPEISIYGCDDSIETVNESSQLNSEIDRQRSPIPLHQMADGDVNYDPTSCMDIMIPGSSFGFSDIQVTESENMSGLESDVQLPTKKMRITHPQKVSPLL